jgi:microcystin-dependent protein
MSVRINQPFDEFTDTAGKPLESGYIYVGTYGLNPETNPITIYSDINLSVPLAQPLRTTGGIPTYLNSPTAIYTTGSYSITVKDSAGRLVFNRPNVDSTGAATIFGWKNYVTNSGFEGGSTGGWNLGKDSGTTVPTSGGLGGGTSGFSPLTLDTTTPLAGSVSLVVTKPTGNIQGSTVYSDPLTFDLEDTVSQGQLTFSYRTPSASTYTNADLSVFLWDITGGALVTLSLTSLDISTSLPKKFFATFTPTTSTKYRVIFQWTSSSNTNAVSITLDSILLGPNITVPDAASVISYGIGGTNAVRNVDFNTLMTGGKYINYGANAPGGYTTLKFSLEVIGRDTDFIVQTATCLEPSYRDITWRRTKNSIWGTWYKTSTTTSTVSALDADTVASTTPSTVGKSMLSAADQAAQQVLVTAGAVGIAALNAVSLTTVTGFKAADTAKVAGTTPGTRGLTALSQATTLDADTLGGLGQSVLVPTGTIAMYGVPSYTPTGWLLCDGSAVSRTTYSNLFGNIGVYFGVGDGVNTFNVPDFRETAPVGVGTRGSGITAHETYTLGQFKDDQFQGHVHQINQASTTAGPSTGGTWYAKIDNLQNSSEAVTGTNGTPRRGDVTRGKRMGVNFIIKYN